MPDSSEQQKTPPVVTIGLNMAVGMAFFTYLGHLLDQKSGGQIWTLTGMFLGLFYCGYEVWKIVRQSGKNQ